MEKLKIIPVDKLLDRVPEPAYLEEWTKLLAQSPKKIEETKESSFVVFRLSKEWFALPPVAFSEIVTQSKINAIPIHNDPSILGIVNLRGQLRFCFSMHVLLGIEKTTNKDQQEEQSYYSRLLAVSNGGDIWTFPVDEVEGVLQFDFSNISNVPVNLLHSKENYLKGVVNWNEKKIYIIDENILFQYMIKVKNWYFW